MILRSLGYRTDLIFPRFEGEIADRGHYLVIRTPSNPTFYWGNFLLFDAPPAPGDFARWRELFAQEIGTPPDINHIALGWDTVDGEAGDAAPFLAAGFHLEESVVLTADAVRKPPKYNADAVVRPLASDDDWEQALQNQIACRGEEHGIESYTIYARRKMVRYRRMADAGLGAWFGAFLGGTLAADLGIYTDSEIARFQSVGTHPDYRRRGLCGTLVYEAANDAFSHWPIETLVMVADVHYHAARIYESVGFCPTERQAALEWWPRGV